MVLKGQVNVIFHVTVVNLISNHFDFKGMYWFLVISVYTTNPRTTSTRLVFSLGLQLAMLLNAKQGKSPSDS